MQEKSENYKMQLVRAVAEVIKNRRAKLNKSMYLISAESSMSKSTWREAELGLCKDINLSTIWKIADGLEVSPSEFIREVEKKLDNNFIIE